jgi:hypothetical protein
MLRPILEQVAIIPQTLENQPFKTAPLKWSVLKTLLLTAQPS